jgi:hypothetical protein
MYGLFFIPHSFGVSKALFFSSISRCFREGYVRKEENKIIWKFYHCLLFLFYFVFLND